MTLNPFKWLLRQCREISQEIQYSKDLGNEAQRILQEMQLSAEGREAENLPLEESFKITTDLLSKGTQFK